MPDDDRRSPTPPSEGAHAGRRPDEQRSEALSGPLARLDRDREQLAKAWLVRLIERASLDQISSLPTQRIATELPELISDVLAAAAGDGDPAELGPAARERAGRLAELRDAREAASAGEVTRDVTAIGAVIFEALASAPEELGSARFATLAAAIGDAVGAVQAAAVETLVARRSRELESLASSDPLTGLSNLRHLQRELRHQLRLQERYSQPCALLVLDVEGLGRINDARGHAAGDRVLVQVALVLRRSIRAVDVPARIGGDEFCVLAPAQTAEGAVPFAQRLAEAVTAETAGGDDDPGIPVAIGVVACPEHGTEVEALLDAADQAMYRARAAGERVAVGEPASPEITVQRTR